MINIVIIIYSKPFHVYERHPVKRDRT